MSLEKISFLKSLGIVFTRLMKKRVHFSTRYLGKSLLMKDGQKFRVIRHLVVDPENGRDDSPAVFQVRFKFSGLSLPVNRRLSVIPAPFLVAKPGFRQKIWSVTEDGCFQGIYEWACKEAAEKYPRSFVFKLMTKRSAEGTLSFAVIPDTVLSDYVESRLTVK